MIIKTCSQITRNTNVYTNKTERITERKDDFITREEHDMFKNKNKKEIELGEDARTEFERVRKEYGFTMKQVSEEIGMSEAPYSLYESGKRTYKTQERQEKFLYKIQQRSEEHTSELQSRGHLVCRLLL